MTTTANVQATGNSRFGDKQQLFAAYSRRLVGLSRLQFNHCWP